MIKNFLIILFLLNFFSLPAFSTDADYSQAAGHTGVYVNVPNVWALKCNIKTYDLTDKNNKLGWYTAWPMIVDYKTGRFVQIGYITSPLEGINKPTFYVSWSNDGKQINIKYLPDKKNVGNAMFPKMTHEYSLSLNADGSVNIQIDRIKYLDDPEEKIKVGFSEGTGEFFSEGSNINIEISTKFTDCFYKLRGDNSWRDMEHDKKIILYYAANGTTIQPIEKGSFLIKGALTSLNKGKFFNKVLLVKKKTKI